MLEAEKSDSEDDDERYNKYILRKKLVKFPKAKTFLETLKITWKTRTTCA